MSKKVKITHELPAIYQSDSKILILGTIPSIKSREVKFYYGHPQNRFWKILEILFNESISDKKEFLQRHHIALWDVLASCEIKGSSDGSICHEVPNDIPKLLEKTEIKVIFTTGKMAHKLYQKYFQESISLKEINLPSTSAANCKKTLSDLTQEYHILLDYLE